MSMQLRIGDLEFRHLDTRKAEIVQWWKRSDSDTESCHTLLWWTRGKEGYDIEFIGGRPFEYDQNKVLWEIMKYGQKVLDAVFDLQEELGIVHER
jgi:hypothetical protein